MEIEKIERNETPIWLEAILNHKLTDMKKLSEEIGDLVHQVKHFKSMEECFQNQVICELNEKMQEKGWRQRIKE